MPTGDPCNNEARVGFHSGNFLSRPLVRTEAAMPFGTKRPCLGRRSYAGALSTASLVVLMAAFEPTAAAAEQIKVGLVRIAANGPVFLALEKGYFAAEGLTVDLVSFDAAQPVAVAVVSGDVDFGGAALTAALYNLAS